MLKNTFAAERLKLKGSLIWLAFFFLSAFSVFLGAVNFSYNQEMLTHQWQSLWTQVSLFYGNLFLPILIAIACAYEWRLEHTGRNWNALMTVPVPRRDIYWGKFAAVAVFSLLAQILFLALYFCAGRIFRFSDPFPASDAARWFFCAWLGSLAVAAMQLLFSMVIRSFAVPIGLELLFCILGFGLAAKGKWQFSPNSLLIAGLGSVNQDALGAVDMGTFVLICFLFIFLFCLLSLFFLRKRDIRTE